MSGTIVQSAWLPWIILLPLIGALINGIFGRHLSRRAVALFGVGSVTAAFALSVVEVVRLAALPTGDVLAADLWQWMGSGSLSINVSFLLDRLSAVMLLVVTGVGSLIHVFSLGYMRDDPSFGRYFAYLNLFMFSMLLLVLGKNLLILFVGWEGVGLCSYLLIGFWFSDMQKAEAGQKAFVTNRVGDLAFLIGTFILLFYSHGTLEFTGTTEVTGGLSDTVGYLAGTPGGDTVITLVAILFFIGATGKSAQIPLYVWLPDAMAGPTPVSALIHAATMVTAGVYMMARLDVLYVSSEAAMMVVAVVGALTALVAATIGLVQNDIKKVLAYSTVSQIGFMVLAVGVGGFIGAIFHLMTHAFFKACLFLGSGSVIHALHHEQDIRKMGGLKGKLPVTRWTFLISCLAIAGVPLFSGFFSKDEILYNTFAGGHYVLWGVAMLAALCTAFYMFRLYFLTFEGTYRGDDHTWEHAHEEPVMNVPLIALAVLATIGGFVGLPHFLHAHALEAWLSPVFSQPSPGGTVAMELILMAVSVGVAGIGIFMAWRLYMGRKLPTAPTASAWHRVLTHKYYVDELYDRAIIRPLRAGAGFLYRVVDVGLIDGIVRGVAKTFGWVGQTARRAQNGDVQAYVTALVVGLAVVLFLVGV